MFTVVLDDDVLLSHVLCIGFVVGDLHCRHRACFVLGSMVKCGAKRWSDLTS